MSKDPRINLFLDFFSSQMGARIVDEDGNNIIEEKPTLCKQCQCATKTLKKDNTCLKCGAKKEEHGEESE